MTCKHCGQPISPFHGSTFDWVHTVGNSSYLACKNQDGYPPLRKAEPDSPESD